MYHLTPQHTEEIVYVPESPPWSIDRLKTADTFLFHEGLYGRQQLQGIFCPPSEIWQFNLTINRDTTFIISDTRPLLNLFVAFQDDYHYDIDGLGAGIHPHRHFNLLYTESLSGKIFTKKDQHYQSFEIHLSLNVLEDLVVNFPVLQSFINKKEKNGIAVFLEKPKIITGDMQAIMYRILYNEYTGKLKQLYLETKIFELLLVVLNQTIIKSSSNTNTLTKYEYERVEEARIYIQKNLDSIISISLVARYLRINEKKMRSGFKQLYNITPFNYLLNVRLDKALELVANTNMSIIEISAHIGYNNVSSFITAFSKRFGQPPISYRKKKMIRNSKFFYPNFGIYHHWIFAFLHKGFEYNYQLYEQTIY